MRNTISTIGSTERERATLLQRLRVPLGFAFGALFLYFSRPTLIPLLVGSLIAFAGLGIRLWSAGHLSKHRDLSVTGPYRHSRNPLYLGSFLLGLGFSIASAKLWLVLLFLVLFLTLYLPVIREEERELESTYGERYIRYREEVSRFFSFKRSLERPADSNFSWQQVILNREYKAVIGSVLILALLILKVFLR